MPSLTTTIEMIEMQCGSCGVHHALSKVRYNSAYEEGGHWFCPNGHQRGFNEGQSTRDAIRLERDRLKQQLAQRDDALKDAEKKIAAETAKFTKLKKRASAGVCPCCNRQFPNLHMHMQSKHKDFVNNVVPIKKEA